MIEAVIGESVILSRRLVKNDKVVTGADLKVRVIELPAGTEVLASTSVPESADPGCYAFEWFGFPTTKTFLKAIYSVKNVSDSEFIQVKMPPSRIAGSELLTGVISSDTLIGEVTDNQEELTGKVTDEEVLSGAVTEEVLSGAISGDDSVFGEITDDTITGTIKDCQT